MLEEVVKFPLALVWLPPKGRSGVEALITDHSRDFAPNLEKYNMD